MVVIRRWLLAQVWLYSHFPSYCLNQLAWRKLEITPVILNLVAIHKIWDCIVTIKVFATQSECKWTTCWETLVYKPFELLYIKDEYIWTCWLKLTWNNFRILLRISIRTFCCCPLYFSLAAKVFVCDFKERKKEVCDQERGSFWRGTEREIDSSERGIFSPLKFLVVEVRSSPFFTPKRFWTFSLRLRSTTKDIQRKSSFVKIAS